MWQNSETYLQWLYLAYEQFKKSRYLYKRTFLVYNRLYWDRLFRQEIKRIERLVETEKILSSEGVIEK
jgi:hypothetical protein